MPEFGMLAPAWLLALPLAWFLPWWLVRRAVRPPLLFPPLRVRHPSVEGFERTEENDIAAEGHWLLLPVIALLCFALTEPVRYGAPLPAKAAPVDIVLLVDVSVSMSLRDYELDGERVDRLTMAKRLLDRFATEFSGERLGIVVIGTPSAIWTPPTADRSLVRHLLGRLQLTMASRNAAIGDALALTVEHFAGARPPVVVLVSDAALPLGRLSPLEGAARLGDADMILYSIAIGAADAGAAERNNSGLIYSPANLPLLEQVAERTGGRLFHAVDAEGMQKALDWIESTHRSVHPAAERPRHEKPLYAWPLAAAILMLATWPWLSERRKRWLSQ